MYFGELRNGERFYGVWAGNPRGNREGKERCVVEIRDRFTSYQCQRKRTCGFENALCKQHEKNLGKFWEEERKKELEQVAEKKVRE